MRTLFAVSALAIFSAASLTAPVLAQHAGELMISKPMLRSTLPGAPVAGGYVTIENTGPTTDTLVAATIDTDVVGRMELHQMLMSDGVMTMSEVEGGIPIPVGETVVLQPGGLHLMLMGMTGPLVEGDSHEVTLTFDHAGEVAVEFEVLSLGAIRATVEEAGTMGHGMSTGHGN